MSDNLQDLQQQMLTAYRDGDRRLTGMLADKILRIDLHNPAAWQVVYNLLSTDQTMPEFQRWFTAKYFPNRLKELEANLPPVPANARTSAQATIPVPAVEVPTGQGRELDPPITGSLSCAKCGEPYVLGTIFCSKCGQFLAAPAANTGELLASAGSKYCPECGTPFSAGGAFCNECGCPRTIIPDEKRADYRKSDSSPLSRLVLDELPAVVDPSVLSAEEAFLGKVLAPAAADPAPAERSAEENLLEHILTPAPADAAPAPQNTAANPAPAADRPARTTDALRPGASAFSSTEMKAPTPAPAPPAPAAAPQVSPAVLARVLRSENFRDVKRALDMIREQKIVVMAPLLLETYDVPRVFTRQNLGEAYTSSVIAALCAICTPDMAGGLTKILRHLNYYVTPASSAAAARKLASFGQHTEALNLLDHWLKPAHDNNLPGRYFPAILACGEIPTAESIKRMLVSVTKEKKVYDTPYASNFIDSVSFLASAANTTAWDPTTPLCSLLLTAPQQVHPAALKNAPLPLLMMLAYHCYADALYNIARIDAHLILEGAQQHDLGIQLAVLGMAMALNRMEEARVILRSALEDPHWSVRAAAYDGLMMHAEQYNRPPDALITTALLDTDVRVVLSAASAMLATTRPEYEPLLLRLLDDADPKRRTAFLQPIAALARRSTTARAVLEKAATSDPDSRVCVQAAYYLKMLA